MKQHDNSLIENPVESLVSDEVLAKIAKNSIEMEIDLLSGTYLTQKDRKKGHVRPLEVYLAMSTYANNPNFLFVFPSGYEHISCHPETRYLAAKLNIPYTEITTTVFEIVEEDIKGNPVNADYRESMLFSRTRLRDMVNYGSNEKFNDISYENYQRRLAEKNKKTDSPEKEESDRSVGHSESSEDDLSKLTAKQLERYEAIKQRAEQAEQKTEQEKQRAKQAEKELAEVKAKLAKFETPSNIMTPDASKSGNAEIASVNPNTPNR